MYDDEIPRHVREMSKEGRIRWYKNKARVEEPVYDYVDSLVSEFPNYILKRYLNNIQENVELIKRKISILECDRFKKVEKEIVNTRVRLALSESRIRELARLSRKGERVIDKLVGENRHNRELKIELMNKMKELKVLYDEFGIEEIQ